MARIVPFPPSPRRTPARTAMLELLANPPGDEEHELIEALRRIVAGSGADALREVYPGARGDRRARIFARYAD